MTMGSFFRLCLIRQSQGLLTTNILVHSVCKLVISISNTAVSNLATSYGPVLPVLRSPGWRSVGGHQSITDRSGVTLGITIECKIESEHNI